jgi:putative PEP-CTERM system histidine kinase
VFSIRRIVNDRIYTNMITDWGHISITLAAITMLTVTAVMTLRREMSRSGAVICAALVATALLELFEICSIMFSGNSNLWKQSALFVEAFLPLLWVLASLTYARQEGPWRIGRLLQFGLLFSGLLFLLPLFIPQTDFFYAPDFPEERVLFLESTGYFFYMFIMACMVWAMVNFETTLANASPEGLWRIKYDIIGFGAILVVLFFYFSQSFLYRTINMSYLPLRSFIMIVGAGMVLFSQFFRHGTSRVRVSRQAAFKSFILLAITIYLIMLGLLGEGMKYLSEPFQRSVALAFIFLSVIGIVLLSLSERFMREVKVVLHKNFYQNKHDYRTQWLRFTELMATARTLDELQQRILSAYCDIFNIGGGALFLFEAGRGGYCMTASYRMPPIQDVIAPGNSLIKFMQDHTWVINIRDDNSDIIQENGYFFGENSIFFVVPLFDGGCLEGFIALGKSIHTRDSFIYEDYDLMKTIARQASLALMHQRLSEQVTQAREVEAIGNVATFVVHDLKNLVSNLSLIAQNAGKYIHNPDFQKDMIWSLGNTVTKMQALIGRLKNLGEKKALKLSIVDLLELARDAARQIGGGRVEVSGIPEKVHADREEIQKVFLNLLLNAIEASGPDEVVTVEVGSVDFPFFRVTDHGCGMSADFIRKDLFKPFSTTKKQGLGIGLYQCRQIVEAHAGRIEVHSEEGKGAVFTVWLPDGLENRD